MNKITIYEGNSVDIEVTINLQDLTGYDGTFYVKKYKADATNIIEMSGVTTGSTVTFRLEEEDTELTPSRYLYEVRIVNIVDTYTVSAGEFIVLDSLAIPE